MGKLDRDKLYVRGQWSTSNPSLQSLLSLHERVSSNIESSTPKAHLYQDPFDPFDEESNTNKKKKNHRKNKSVSEVMLERQRDATVLTQSLAKSKLITKSRIATSKTPTHKSKIIH